MSSLPLSKMRNLWPQDLGTNVGLDWSYTLCNQNAIENLYCWTSNRPTVCMIVMSNEVICLCTGWFALLTNPANAKGIVRCPFQILNEVFGTDN